jgi:uncharacterized protein DUF6582
MVDPNPARGMPLQLQRYWLAGKGAAKIRWNIPGDFKRCVRNLRKYFPRDPEGLCNILHTKATGGPPGHGSLEPHKLHHSVVAAMSLSTMDALVAAQKLLDKQPDLGQYTWAGKLAPIGKPTGEPRRTRIFEPGALYHRALPLPLDWRPQQDPGHGGAMTVGRILGLTYGPDENGQDCCFAWGDWLDSNVIPEAERARYLTKMGVAGPSLDPGGPVHATVDPQTGYEHMLKFGIGGATMVPIPAFTQSGLYVFDGDEEWPDDADMAMGGEEDCGCGGSSPPLDMKSPAPKAISAADSYTVNPSGWRGLPLAPREAVFNNDDAVKRITAWAAGDANKMRKAFLWSSPTGNPTDPTSYRLPVGDIINGALTVVFHAIYAAAALMSGAHGGLPDVSPEDTTKIRATISDIYAEMSKTFGDASLRAPWDRSVQEGVQLAMDQFAASQPYGDVKYADPGYRDNQKRYPIDTPEHIRAAWAYINQADNAKFYNANQLAQIKQRIKAAAAKAGIEIADSGQADEGAKEKKGSGGDSYSSTGLPIYPPKAWFEDPRLTRKTKLTVTEDGHVFGHLAAWNECHRDVTMRECVLAPHSEQEYRPFHLGSVMTAEGELIDTGKIVMDTKHAGIHLGYAAAAVHYDNTGDEIAAIRCGEDQFGIWFSGAIVPEATPQKIAKLRRSPLSGDWRREGGSLELTAALAVNAPAFPVYSMEDDERTALVAAGSVWFDDEPQESYSFTPPTGIVETLNTAVQDAFSAAGWDGPDERAQRLRDLLEDEAIYAKRDRMLRLHMIFAADQQEAAQ